jgi:hypothetical protein
MLMPFLLKMDVEESDIESAVSRSTEATRITTVPALSVKLSVRTSPSPRSASLAMHTEKTGVNVSCYVL